jgi:hypothetical protein
LLPADITATIVELAGISQHVPAERPLDGKSFVPVLTSVPQPVGKWRNFSLTEFYVGDLTWWSVRHIGASGEEADFTFHWYLLR